mmetsp:Transcript_37017/g.92974  ORF Transcript_37017/g.92974 Transcript_37017/m.92974 type:complete len:140 (-) Transcript_37017:312-731(-)
MPAVVCLAGMGGMDLLNIKDVDGNTAMSLASRDWGKEKLTAFCNLKSIKGLKDKKVAEYLSKVGKMPPASKSVYKTKKSREESDEEEEGDSDESGSEEEEEAEEEAEPPSKKSRTTGRARGGPCHRPHDAHVPRKRSGG